MVTRCSPGYSLFTGSLGNGWTVTSGEVLIERGTVNGIPHSGNQYAYLDGDFAFNTLSQTIATTPGKQYTVSFWVADSDPNSFVATFAGQTLYNGPAPASGSSTTHYVNEMFTVSATSARSALTFSGQWTSGLGTVLDDVSVLAVPEPSTAILFLFGAAFLAAAELRSRRLPTPNRLPCFSTPARSLRSPNSKI